MKASTTFRMLVFSGLAFAGASCQQEQQAGLVPKVDSITSSTIKVQHDTVALNKIMNAPATPDSVPNPKK
jgi:hypothetical protein